MIEFIPIDLGDHRSDFIELNIEFLTYIYKSNLEHFNHDLESDLGGSIPNYVRNSIEKMVFHPPDGIFFIIKDDDNMVGMGALKKLKPKIGEIKRMYVRPSYRRRGIGKKLLEKLLEKAKEFQYSVVRLDSANYMKSAHRVYEALDFKYIDPYPECEGYNFHGKDADLTQFAVFMEKQIQ